MRYQSCQWIPLCLLHIAIFSLGRPDLCADIVSTTSATSPESGGSSPILECAGGGARHAAAWQEYEHAARLAAAGDARSVDWFFSSAQAAWEDLTLGLTQDPPRLWHGTLHLYNSAVMSLVVHGHRFGRLDPSVGLRVADGEGWQTVPIVSVDLHWRLDQIDCLRPALTSFEDPKLAQSVRHGVGAALVGIHRRRPGVPGEDHYLKEHPLPITAVFGVNRLAGGFQLEFHNPVTHQTLNVAGRELRLSNNIAGALEFAMRDLLRDVNPVTAFLNPEIAVNYEGLLLLQPYQPGKIPVVLVHGLLSNVATWGPLINALLNNPALMERFQIWGYLYPTGVTILKTASDLRKELRNTLAFLDPLGQDPALGQMMLIGHSMGGLLSKLQVTWSGNQLWDEFANVPFGQIRGDANTRQTLAEMFFFGPQPFVTRVVFMAVPHQGSEWNTCVLAFLGRCLAGRPPTLVRLWDTLNLLNPGVLRFPFRWGLPSSLDALAASSRILAAMNRLPFSSRVRLHSIIGTGGCEPCCSGDGLVSIESARLLGVESELFVDATHNLVKEHPDSIREVQRILWVHWDAYAAHHTPRAPAPRSPVPVPSPAD